MNNKDFDKIDQKYDNEHWGETLHFCEICDARFWMNEFGNGICPKCGQPYMFDECINIQLFPYQLEALRELYENR